MTQAPPADWLHHLADEADAAFLYRELAQAERDPGRSKIYGQLAEVEDRHVEAWQTLLTEQGHTVKVPPPSRDARIRAWVARRIGPGVVLPLLLEEEGREVKSYLSLYREAPEGAAGPTALKLARESKEHAERLAAIGGGAAEPWHKTGAGGFLRNVVYGFNDGLTANFGLVAGMIGAQGANLGSHAVLVAGVAGMVADALSMGSSGYLAAKSEREVFEHEIAMERDEIKLMPELEGEELSLIYQAKGIPAAQADALAAEVMKDPGARAGREGARGTRHRRGDEHADAGGLGHRDGHGARRAHPGGAVLLRPRTAGHLDVVRAGDAEPLRGRRGAELLHRARHRPQRDGHVPGGTRRGRDRLRGGRLDREAAIAAAASQLDSHTGSTYLCITTTDSWSFAAYCSHVKQMLKSETSAPRCRGRFFSSPPVGRQGCLHDRSCCFSPGPRAAASLPQLRRRDAMRRRSRSAKSAWDRSSRCYDAARRLPTREEIASRAPSLWRYREWLPLEGDPPYSPDTGFTPLVEVPRLAPLLGVARVWVKNDAVSHPSLSFKDRVVAAAINAAAAFGLDTVGCASTGNLANAVAAQAARAGLPAWIFIPDNLELRQGGRHVGVRAQPGADPRHLRRREPALRPGGGSLRLGHRQRQPALLLR